MPQHARGVVTEPVGNVAIQPAAAIVERRREVPVKKCCVGHDVRGEESIHEPLVPIESGRVDRAGTLGKNATPADAEPVCLKSQLAHHRDVILPSIIVVARDVTGVTVDRASGTVGEPLPDARPRTVRKWTAFDLVCGGGRPPEERVGKSVGSAHAVLKDLAKAGWGERTTPSVP